MIKKNLDSDKHKLSSLQAKDAASADFKHKHYHVAEAAVGDKNNDYVITCRICASTGWPHEPIDFEKIPGRMLADGTRETAGWRLKNYYTGEPHHHKQGRRY
jgi:hypothetical protein